MHLAMQDVKPEIGEIQRVEIVDITSSGDGVGRRADRAQEGQPSRSLVVFVPGTIPGEVADVGIVEVKKGHVVGKLVEVVKKAEGRIEPPCPYVPECPGCSLQHMDYPTQCSAKLNRFERSLSRTLGVGAGSNVDFVPSPEPFGYRTHIGIACEKWGGELLIGLIDPDSRSTLDIDRCLLVPDWANERYGALRQVLRENILELPKFFRLRLFLDFDSKEMYPVATRGPEKTHRWFPDKLRRILKGFPTPRSLEREIAGVKLRIHPASFVQANYYLTGRLYEEGLKAASASEEDVALELYAGSGFHTLALGPKVKRVVAVEADRRAVENLTKSVKKSRLESRIQVLQMRAEDLDRETMDEIKPSIVIANPPRSGLHPRVTEVILGWGSIREIVMISCDAATLARDAARLISGGFSPGTPVILDCYPQTAHTEVVLGFRKAI
jgi:23S rRNA (uracil1939-C5)-methyltransferase